MSDTAIWTRLKEDVQGLLSTVSDIRRVVGVETDGRVRVTSLDPNVTHEETLACLRARVSPGDDVLCAKAPGGKFVVVNAVRRAGESDSVLGVDLASQAEAESPTSSTPRLFSGQRVAQAISARRKRDGEYDVTDYGAVGNDIFNCQPAFQAAIDAAAAVGGTVFVPAGTFRLATGVVMPSNVRVRGVGWASRVNYVRTLGDCFSMSSVSFVTFERFRVTIANSNTSAFYLSNSSRCVFDRVIIHGTHDVGALADYTQRGFAFVDNAGDNRLVNCDINNCGTGIYTDAIMNYMVGGVVGSCRHSVQGGDATGAAFNAGFSFSNVTFLGSGAAVGLTERHIYFNGSGAELWLSQVWLEKASYAIHIGNANGGVRSLSIRGARISGVTECLNIQGARQAHIEDITFGNEAGTATPTELTINATGAPEGFAANLRSAQVFDFASSVFPAKWFAYLRGSVKMPT